MQMRTTERRVNPEMYGDEDFMGPERDLELDLLRRQELEREEEVRRLSLQLLGERELRRKERETMEDILAELLLRQEEENELVEDEQREGEKEKREREEAERLAMTVEELCQWRSQAHELRVLLGEEQERAKRERGMFLS